MTKMRVIAALAAALLCAPAFGQSQFPAHTTWGNPTTSTALPKAMTQAEVAAMCNTFTSLLVGCVPASGGGTANFLRADGTWTVPASSLAVGTTPISGGTSLRVLYDNAGVLGEYTNTQLTALINPATASLSGALPAWPNNTTTFFRGDGTYTQVGNAALVNASTTVNGTACTLGSSCTVTLTAAGFANPTATIGLTAVNGSATTAMRSDAAPALPAGVNANVLNAQTTTYSVATTDCGKTITLGGSAFYTVSVAAASGFPATCSIKFANIDTGRGKFFSVTGTNVGPYNILWPLQSFTLSNQSNTWSVSGLNNRWILSSATTNFYVDPSLGNDSNDGLAAGSGGAWQTLQRAVSLTCGALDLNENSIIVNLANSTGYTKINLCHITGFSSALGYNQVTFSATPIAVTTPVASPGVVNATGHGLSNGNTVFFSVTGGALPTGLSQGVPYFVINSATDTFQVSATQGGSAINFTGSSTGTQTIVAPVKTQLSASGGNGVGIFASGNTPFAFKGIQFTNCTVACIEGDSQGVVALDAVDFASVAGNHVISLLASRIAFINSGYSVTGGAGIHWQTTTAGIIFIQPGKTVAIGTGITFSIALSYAEQNSVQSIRTITFNGSATCTAARLFTLTGGGIDTNGGGATYLPCSAGAAGNSITNPGWYN